MHILDTAARLPGSLEESLAEDSNQFFRLRFVDHLATCTEDDCDQDTRIEVETQDEKSRPVCSQHAHVLFADWMVGA